VTKLNPKNILHRLWGRVNIFIISVILTALITIIYQIVIYIANVDLRHQHQREIEFTTNIKWGILENIINNSIEQASENINNIIIPNIVEDINEIYGSDQNKLQSDLEKLNDWEYDNPIVKIMADNIRGKYFNNITTDSNDMFVLMKQVGIISDLSISQSSKSKRTIDFEISQHYNKELAREAYDAIISQNYQKKYIFWQWYEPEYPELAEIKEMKLSEIEKIFRQSGGDIQSLKTIEFLVPEYIFVDKDILGNLLVNDRGNRQDIYQFIVIQGFNVSEIIDYDETLKGIFESMKTDNLTKRYQTISFIYQLMIFVGTLSLIYIALNVIRTKNKYNI